MSNPFDIFLPAFVPFVTVLEQGLTWLAELTGSGGLAIILFTVFLKLVLTPLSLMQTKSMKAMQAIAPRSPPSRRSTPKTASGMAQEQMRLYKEHGVNPGRRCLPMIPMMIVLIGLYQALIHLSCDPNNAANIAMTYCIPSAATLPSTTPGSGSRTSGRRHPDQHRRHPDPSILPIAMLITQFAYGKMTPTTGMDDPQQQMMMRMTTYFMPIMLFFSFNFPGRWCCTGPSATSSRSPGWASPWGGSPEAGEPLQRPVGRPCRGSPRRRGHRTEASDRPS